MTLLSALKLTLVKLTLLLPTVAHAVEAASASVVQPRAATILDVNRDGVADRLVGDALGVAHGVRGGTVTVLDGRTGVALFSFAGDSTGDRFGWSVAVAGDVDGDGRLDFIIGAPLDDAAGNASGSVFVYSGRDGRLLYRFTGGAAGEQFGYSVRSAGDVDGDGHADILVGAPFADAAGHSAGYTRALSGKDGSVIRTVHGSAPNERRGASLARS